MNRNLEQIRALHAFRFWSQDWPDRERGGRRLKDIKGEQGGDVVRGLSSLIITNGLLAALAFAKDKKKGYQTFMEEIGRYLCSSGEDGRSVLKSPTASLDDFITVLTQENSFVLQRATEESLAYLAYLKRFRTV